MAVEGAAGLREIIGQVIGPSEWRQISQEQINLFADATGDHQWIHVDADRATTGPFGATIAHGFLTLALVPTVLAQLVQVDGFAMGVNYGLDRVRFPTPVRVGSRLRGTAIVDEVSDIEGGIQATVSVTIELENSAKPACVAVFLMRRYR